MIEITQQLAEKIGYNLKTLERAKAAGYFSDRLAFDIEIALGLELRTLPRKPPHRKSPRLSTGESRAFVRKIRASFPDHDLSEIARFLGVHYEKARSIMSMRVRATAAEVRSVIATTKMDFREFDKNPPVAVSPIDDTLGAHVRLARYKKGITAEVLAEKMNCSPYTLSRLETGRDKLKRDKAELLSQILDYPHLLQLWDQYNASSET